MDEVAIRADIDRARALSQTLGRDRLRALGDALRSRVAEWRWADAHSVPHRPDPWLAILDDRAGGWRDRAGDDAIRVGLDGEARPLVVEAHSYGDRYVTEVWEHDDGASRGFEWLRGAFRATILRGPPGPVTSVAWAQDGGNEFGVERWHDRETRGEVASVSVDGWAVAHAHEVHLDADGRVTAIWSGSSQAEIEVDSRVPADRAVDALLDAVGAAASIECRDPLWQADRHRPEPDLRPTPQLVAALIAGLAAAIDKAFAAAAVRRPFVIEHRPYGSGAPFEMHLPGAVRIGSERFRDEMRSFSSRDGGALSMLWKGEETGQVASVDLADHCDRDTLRACREVNTALSHHRGFEDADQQRARTALDALGARLSADLNRQGRFANAAEPFLALVEVGDPFGEGDALTRARRALGPDRVERFRASLTSEVTVPSHVDTAREDRDALAAWLTERGLGEQAQRLAHEVAQRGFRLVPGAGNTRLGGPGLLPPGTDWPRATAGRPLTFLAGVDFAEFPDPDPLPARGWLLFFADLDDAGEALGFIGEPTQNEPGADAQVLYTDAPVPGEPPPDLPHEERVRLPELRVVPHPQLTLDDGWNAGEALGLGPAQAEAYDEIAYELRSGATGDEFEVDDWVLGSVTGVQGESPEEGTTLLLHLASVEFMDAGAIQFRIPDDALAARDWSQIVAEGDSA